MRRPLPTGGCHTKNKKINKSEMNRNWYAREGRELHVDVWCKNLKETKSLKDLDTDGKNIEINLKRNPRRDVDCVSVYWARDRYHFFGRR
jgi:hypothetical protein